MRKRLLGNRDDGAFVLKAQAWCVRGGGSQDPLGVCRERTFVNGVRKQISDNAARRKGCLNFLYVEACRQIPFAGYLLPEEFVDEGGVMVLRGRLR